MFNKFLRIVLILLIAICIFDPANKILGLKVPLFILAWILLILDIIANRKIVYVPKGMILYLMLFLLIPLISIAYYFFAGSDFVNYDGFQYFKSYLFVTVVFILYVSKIDLIKPAVAIISALSVVSIMILIISYIDVPLFDYLQAEVGTRYGIFSSGYRDYGGFVMPEVYFHTAQLIVFPIAYFTAKVFYLKGVNRVLCGSLLAINIVAMFFGATRNNIMVSMLTPILILYCYSERKKYIVGGTIMLLSMIFIYKLDVIESMFSARDPSNSAKLSHVEDYLNLFADKNILLFGQGLGSYFNSTVRGYVPLTELTYFEFIRRFGLILSLPSFALILYPLSKLRLKKYYSAHYIFIAYLFYLIMSFTNPFLMSSSGMLLLSIVLYKTFSPVSSMYQSLG